MAPERDRGWIIVAAWAGGLALAGLLAWLAAVGVDAVSDAARTLPARFAKDEPRVDAEAEAVRRRLDETPTPEIEIPPEADAEMDDAPPGATVLNPRWARQPQAVYPERAERAGVMKGVVDLSCVADEDGRMYYCRIWSEDPAGYGFGEAAIDAAREARIMPREVNGEPTPSVVRWRMRFILVD